MTARRGLLRAAGAMALAPAAATARPAPPFGEPFARAIRAAEAMAGGRLGIALLDSDSGERFAWRGDERFPLTSTFKCILAGAVLAEVDGGRQSLGQRILIRAADLVDHAPVTGRQLGPEGLSVAELCEATMVWSDNPAANLLLATLGGPAGLTGFARRIGDRSFRLDRRETALNEARPGDPRDTTTPQAMLGSLDRLLLGTALTPTSRDMLTGWMLACRTGERKIRAGLPAGWRCGDKTGGGGHGTNNDIAILWPPGRPPVLVTSYLTDTPASLAVRDAALAAIGRAIAEALG